MNKENKTKKGSVSSTKNYNDTNNENYRKPIHKSLICINDIYYIRLLHRYNLKYEIFTINYNKVYQCGGYIKPSGMCFSPYKSLNDKSFTLYEFARKEKIKRNSWVKNNEIEIDLPVNLFCSYKDTPDKGKILILQPKDIVSFTEQYIRKKWIMKRFSYKEGINIDWGNVIKDYAGILFRPYDEFFIVSQQMISKDTQLVEDNKKYKFKNIFNSSTDDEFSASLDLTNTPSVSPISSPDDNTLPISLSIKNQTSKNISRSNEDYKNNLRLFYKYLWYSSLDGESVYIWNLSILKGFSIKHRK